MSNNPLAMWDITIAAYDETTNADDDAVDEMTNADDDAVDEMTNADDDAVDEMTNADDDAVDDETKRWNKDEVYTMLRGYCKNWVFQLEKGESTGFLHWQCRVSLIKKKRLTAIMKLVKEGKLFGHWTPTTNEVHNGNNFNYVMKEDTKIAGPWKDDDTEKIMTKQLKEFLKYDLRSYQRYIFETAQKFNMRSIHIVYDSVGNIGKSIFGEFMEYYDLAEEIPPYRMMDDIFQWVCTNPIKKSYFVDMPRGMKKDRLGDFYSGIEVIKNGVAYDKRYSGKKIRFDRPQIFIFTNTLPAFSLMSKDRWVILNILPDYSYSRHEVKDLTKDDIERLRSGKSIDDDDSDSSWVEE